MSLERPAVFAHIQSLDGIRGVAVLLVILIHSRLCSFGWVGVQMFFVLSGFLITRILIADTKTRDQDKRSGQEIRTRDQDKRSLGRYLCRFYWRRSLRIWPLYFGFLAVCTMAYGLIRIPETLNTAWPWLLTFTYNFGRFLPGFLDSDYFGHFWTLCVEEQFYLLWPFVVFYLPRIWLRRIIILLVVCGPLLRFISGAWLGAYYEAELQIAKGVHSLPTSHLDAFAFGALLTVLPDGWQKWLSVRAVSVFLIVLGITVVAGLSQALVAQQGAVTPSWLALGYGGLAHYRQYIWAYTLLNASSAMLIFCALQGTYIQRWLMWPWLCYIGKISFGLYVLHLPLMRVSHIIWPADYHSVQGLIRFALYFAITFGVSSASYYLYERKFLAMKKDSAWSARPN